LKVLIALEVLLPIGLFFGLMLGLGKLHSDSEIVALQAGGIGEFRILRPILALAIPLALIIAGLSIYARPWAFTQTYEMLAVAKASSDIDRIKAGQFYLTRTESPSPSNATPIPQEDAEAIVERERVVFIETISPDQALEGVFIRTKTGSDLQVISSKTGLLVESPESEDHTLELENARIFKQVDDGPNLFARIEHFTMRVKTIQPELPGYKSKSVASSKLASSNNLKDQAEYQWRISTSITTFLLALLAVPLSRSRPRQGRYAKLLLAFIVYAAYYNFIGVGRTWVEQGVTTSIWWAPAILALLVILAYLPWHSLKINWGRASH
jgi:lipopolysaccharide export system permease protein